MTPDVLGRMLWKEYRALRPFWLAVVGIVAFCLVIVLFIADGPEYRAAFYAIAGGAVVLYALGAGATVFAVEREDETITFLQTLPLRGRQVVAAKVGLAAASIVALAVSLSAMAGVFDWLSTKLAPQPAPWAASHSVDWSAVLESVGSVALAIWHLFMWGLFFSLVLRRPLVAACLAAVSAMVAFPTALSLGFHIFFPAAASRQAAELIGVFLVPSALLVVDLWLGTHWLEGLSPRTLLTRRRKQRAGEAVFSASGRPVPRPGRFIVFQRLLWQEFRQAWPSLLVLAGASVILAILTSWYPQPANDRRVQHVLSALPAFTMLIAVVGAFVFRADQEGGRYRFFAERPVSPRSVWWNRQFIWLPIIVAWLVLLTPIWTLVVFSDLRPLFEGSFKLALADEEYRQRAANWDRGVFGLPAIMTFGIFVFSAYGCGQLCSLLFRSGIIAGFLAVVVTWFVAAWLFVTGLLGVWFMIAAAPIPLWLLWASWLRAPDWIAERKGRRPAVRLALSLVLPALAIGGATIAYRVLQIPDIVPGFPAHTSSLATPAAAQQTADMYRRAADQLASSEWPAGLLRAKNISDFVVEVGDSPDAANAENRLAQLRWLDDNAEALKLAIAATAQPDCALPVATMPDDDSLKRISALAWLLATDARRLAFEGKLDEAFDRELAILRLSVHLRMGQFVTEPGDKLEARTLRVLRDWWAALPGQTSEHLRRAIVALETWQKSVPGPEQEIEARYRWCEKLLSLDPHAIREAERFDRFYIDEKVVARRARLMPWELARAKRLLNWATAEDLGHSQLIVAGVKSRDSMSQRVRAGIWWSPALNLLATTAGMHAFQQTHYQHPAQAWIRGLAEYRTTRLCLAIAAWQLDHDRRLTTLSDIVGEYLPEIPRDPYWGHPYVYYPFGVGQELAVNWPRGQRIAAGTPFIWGAGPDMYQLGTDDSPMQHAEFYTLNGKWLRMNTQKYELLSAGWAVPVLYGPASALAAQPENDAAPADEKAESPAPAAALPAETDDLFAEPTAVPPPPDQSKLDDDNPNAAKLEERPSKPEPQP